MRLFIAIGFDTINKYINGIQDKFYLKDAKIKFSKDCHLTLKFLGDVNEEKIDKIKDLLNEISFNGFSLQIGSLEYFESRNTISTIFLNVKESDELLNLYGQIEEKLEGIFQKDNRFHPHLTIGRVKFVNNKKKFKDKINNIKTEKKEITVDEFLLIKSTLTREGPIYEIINRFQNS